MPCERCAELEEKIRQLETELYGQEWEPPRELGLTLHESVILQTLLRWDRIVPIALLFEATRSAGRAWRHDVDHKVVSIRISTIRRKMRPYGITIENVMSTGYRLTPETRARLLNWPTSQAA